MFQILPSFTSSILTGHQSLMLTKNVFPPDVRWFPCQIEPVPHLLLGVRGLLCSLCQTPTNFVFSFFFPHLLFVFFVIPQPFTFSFPFLLPLPPSFLLPGSPSTSSSSSQAKRRKSLFVKSIFIWAQIVFSWHIMIDMYVTLDDL